MEMSAKRQLQYYIRVIAYLMEKAGTHEVRIPLKDLDHVHAVGTVVENGELLIALGDKPKLPIKLPTT